MKKEILKSAFINSFLTALYIGLVASFLFYVPKHFFGDKPDTVFAPIMMIMLFVFSAALTGTLVFGKPMLWYLDGKKREAVNLLIYTISIFFVIMILAFSVVVVFS